MLSAAKAFVVFAAAAILVANLFFPTIQVQRGSMASTLYDGERIILTTIGEAGRGDIIAFNQASQAMVKRVIAVAGQWVNIDEHGTVYVDGVMINEPYLTARSIGICDIELPFQVPDNHLFVMGDNRSVSIDSRLREFGTVHRDEVIGRAIFRIWPLYRIGLV